MAQLTDLLRALQPLDGRDKQTLYNSARKLRNTGYLPKGKRGAGAPEMGFLEAAIVLLGVIGSTKAVDLPERLVLLMDLKCSESEWMSDDPTKGTNLLQALVALLSNLPTQLLEIGKLLVARNPDSDDDEDDITRTQLRDCVEGRGPIDLRVMLRNRSARIELISSSGVLRHVDYVSNPYSDVAYLAYLDRPLDREVIIQFGLPMLFQAYMCVAEDEDRELMAALVGYSKAEGSSDE